MRFVVCCFAFHQTTPPVDNGHVVYDAGELAFDAMDVMDNNENDFSSPRHDRFHETPISLFNGHVVYGDGEFAFDVMDVKG